MSEPLVIIGNGMAAVRLVEELAKHSLGRYAIAVIGDEPRLAYNRVLLSSVLAREVSKAEIELRPAQWWRDRGVTLLYGQSAAAVAIDAGIRRMDDWLAAHLLFPDYVDEVFSLSFVDPWFLDQIEDIVAAEKEVAAAGIDALGGARPAEPSPGPSAGMLEP